jgi:hypothetical protein
MRPGHHWFCEFGDAGNGTGCERQFNRDHRKCDEQGNRATQPCVLLTGNFFNLFFIFLFFFGGKFLF